MNAGTQTARSAPLPFVAANEVHAHNAGVPCDFQNLFSLAMDRALGIEKASLSTVVSLNSCLLDLCQDAFRVTPAFGNLFDLVAQAVAYSMELPMSWLTLQAPQVCGTVARRSGRQSEPAADDFAYCMDIAIGEQSAAPGVMVTSISGGPAQPKAKAKSEALEHSMDVAMRMWAA